MVYQAPGVILDPRVFQVLLVLLVHEGMRGVQAHLVHQGQRETWD